MDYSKYKTFMHELALEAGEMILEDFNKNKNIEVKSDGTRVTNTDKRVNDLVIQKINESFPDHSIIGEEKSALSESEYTWVCDPIDGTLPFTLGLHLSVFSLALLKDGEPIVAIVLDPYQNNIYYAEKGNGAFLNDTKIQVSEENDLDNAVIGIHYRKGTTYSVKEIVNELYEKNCKIINTFSIIILGCLVASGKIDGVVFGQNTTHDAATLALIIPEAGGKFTDIKGNHQRYDEPIRGFIGGNSEIVQKIKDIRFL